MSVILIITNDTGTPYSDLCMDSGNVDIPRSLRESKCQWKKNVRSVV